MTVLYLLDKIAYLVQIRSLWYAEPISVTGLGLMLGEGVNPMEDEVVLKIILEDFELLFHPMSSQIMAQDF
jgi:hypothetical protein